MLTCRHPGLIGTLGLGTVQIVLLDAVTICLLSQMREISLHPDSFASNLLDLAGQTIG